MQSTQILKNQTKEQLPSNFRKKETKSLSERNFSNELRFAKKDLLQKSNLKRANFKRQEQTQNKKRLDEKRSSEKHLDEKKTTSK
ncbi:MAG: hypothetical protein ACI86H_000303 [bacterium]|jgi:hypothetical protein